MAAREPIELHRRFVAHRPDQTGHDDRLARMWARGAYGCGWEELLRNRTAIVLGEAGTGKTTEFRRQAARLRAQGRHAFFVRMEDVVSDGLRDALSGVDEPLLDAWLHRAEKAWFFLDAVDESRLRGLRLERGLRRLQRDLGPHLSRAHLFLSCRVSDWTSADGVAIARLRQQSQGDDGAGEVEVFRLVSLDTDQLRLLAAHEGVHYTDALVAGIERAGAWVMVERPLDVTWLAAYWRQRGDLGSWTELMNHNVSQKLQERRGRSSSLSPKRARRGAAALACAAVLTRQYGIAVPGQETERQDALNASRVLDDWDAGEVQQLLSRGLFDEATYGRVRIHHRSVLEYLAAEHLRGRLDAGLPASDVLAVLFPRKHGQPAVVRPLASVAAWLAPTHSTIRRRLIDLAPEHLLDEGDPAQLVPQIRSRVLRVYAQRYAERRHVSHFFQRVPLSRFATPQMQTAVNDLLLDDTFGEHVHQTLLEVVEAGRLTGCMAAVRGRLSSASIHVRHAALEAFVAIAEEGELRERVEHELPSLHQDHRAAEILSKAAFPQSLSVDEIAAVLRAMQPSSRSQFLQFEYVLTHELVERLDPAGQHRLLQALVADPTEKQGSGKDARMVPRQHLEWLGTFVATLADRVLEAGWPLPELKLCAELLELIQRQHHIHQSLWHLDLKKRQHLRRAVFWHCVDEAEAAGRYAQHLYDVKVPPIFRIEENDIVWLARDADEHVLPQHRRLVFTSILQLLPNDQWETNTAVQALVAKHPELAKRYRRALQRQVVDPLKIHPHMRDYQRQDALLRRKRERKRRIEQSALMERLDAIRAGTDVRALIELYFVGIRGSGQRGFAMGLVEAEHGAEVAAATALGVKALWRNRAPTPIHDFPENQTPLFCKVALAAIALEVEQGLDVASLEPPLIGHAIGYAAWSLNAFPGWMDACAAQHPALVRERYEPCIELDFAQPDPEEAGRPNLGRLLHKLEIAPASLQRACAPVLVQRLEQADPPSVQILGRVLAILAAAQGPRLDPALVAGRTLASTDHARFAVWWRHWLQVDTAAAVAVLEQVLQQREQADADALVMGICGVLWHWSERDTAGIAPLAGKTVPLMAFVRILYRHLRPDEDRDHGSGVFKPQPRDHAESLRGKMVGWLADCGPEGEAAIEQMTREALFSPHRDWFLTMLETRRMTLAPMALDDAVKFVTQGRFEPRTSDDLFGLVLDRLETIGDDIERGSFSVRSIYNPSDDAVVEHHAQLLLASRLDLISRNQYVVSREPEDARGNKPDIWVQRPGVVGPTAMEIKVAERWTGSKLLDGLCTQLVDKYLQAVSARCGIYVLCSSGPLRKEGWQTPEGETLNLRDFATYLRRCANNIVRRRADIDALAVLVIDFHD